MTVRSSQGTHARPLASLITGKLVGLLLDFVQILSTQKLTVQKEAFFFLALIWDSLLLPIATCVSVFN